MTTDQFEKGNQLFYEIRTLKEELQRFQSEKYQSLIMIDRRSHWFNEVVANDLENVRLLACQHLRDEVIELFNAHIIRLEDELSQI